MMVTPTTAPSAICDGILRAVMPQTKGSMEHNCLRPRYTTQRFFPRILKESLTYAPILLHLAKSAHGLGVLDKRFTKDFQF